MTVEQAKQKLLAWVSAQVGTREAANNRNVYAEDPRLRQLYGWNAQNQPWCDLFTDEAFIACFGLEIGAAMTYQPVGGGSAACRTSAGFFKSSGAFVSSPEPGDVIFFYASGDINHQGVVIRVVGGSVITVEGNSSDMVAERCYSVGDRSIAGYGRPRWELAAEEPSPTHDEAAAVPPEWEAYTLRLPYLQCGCTGEAVLAVQAALIGRGISCGPEGADGDFGPNTEKAVREFQRGRCIAEDGVIGVFTGAALFGGSGTENPADNIWRTEQ